MDVLLAVLITRWDVSSGNLIRTLTGHKNSVYSVTFSPEGKLASGYRDGMIKLWR
ncbi:MAG TPA: hypothetical protein ENG03_07245 [Thioploca sp.]|nr:hypothetical protein [Thioploca sp.]